MTNEAIDWSRYMEGLQGKANTDIDNLSDIGKNNIAGMGMPSSRFINLTLKPSGSTYIAPANGRFIVTGKTQSNGSFVGIENFSNGDEDHNVGNLENNILTAGIDVLKGDEVRIIYLWKSLSKFRFIYAEGSN